MMIIAFLSKKCQAFFWESNKKSFDVAKINEPQFELQFIHKKRRANAIACLLF
jgi:hypothetical protein